MTKRSSKPPKATRPGRRQVVPRPPPPPIEIIVTHKLSTDLLGSLIGAALTKLLQGAMAPKAEAKAPGITPAEAEAAVKTSAKRYPFAKSVDKPNDGRVGGGGS